MKDKISIVIKAGILTSVILASYFAGHSFGDLFNFHNSYVSGMWCAVTAVVVFDDLPSNARNLFRDRLLGTFVGAVVGGGAVTWLGHLFLALCLALFLVCVLVTTFKWHGALKIACITVLIVSFTTVNYSVREIWASSAMRFAEGVLGGSFSLLATLLLHKGRAMGLPVGRSENSD